MARNDGLLSGIRTVKTQKNENGSETVEIVFGPHYRLELQSDGENTTFPLVTTHHGFRVDASEVSVGLDCVIDSVRENFPDFAVD